MTDGGWSRTLHASWTGIVFTSVGLALFIALAVTVLVVNGLGIITGAFALLAVVSAIVILRDMPIATEFTEHEIIRRTPLRRHRIRWEDVSRLSRARSGIVRTRAADKAGGLAVRIGTRRYPLTDRMESAIEFDMLRDLIGHARSDALGLSGSIRPVDGRSPTWQYRRRHWHLQ